MSAPSSAVQYRNSPRPVLPWLGSKEPFLESFTPYYPAEVSGCLSLFCGGMAVLLDLLHKIETGSIKLVDQDGKPAERGSFRVTDVVQDVIHFYNHLKYDWRSLVLSIAFVIECLYDDPTADTLTHSYAKLKGQYNAEQGKTSIMRSAQFWVLMQLCWYHAYRVDSQGAFVAPFQQRSTCRLDKEAKDNMYRVSALLRKYDVQIECASFESARQFDNDYMLLDVDPPYIDAGTKSQATAYSAPLTDEQQELLVRMVKERPRRRFIMTQSNTEWVKGHFPQEDYQVVEVDNEVIITNAPKEGALLLNPVVAAVYPTLPPVPEAAVVAPNSTPAPVASHDTVEDVGAALSAKDEAAGDGQQVERKSESQATPPARPEVRCRHAVQHTTTPVHNGDTSARVSVCVAATGPTSAAVGAAIQLATPAGDGRCMALTDKNARCRNGRKCVRCNQRGDRLEVCTIHLKKGRQDLDPDVGLRGWVDIQGGTHFLPPGQRQWVP